MVGGHLVSWKRKKQPVVSKSSSEAEHRAMGLGDYELLWLRILAYELDFIYKSPMVLHYDSTSTQQIALNP